MFGRRQARTHTQQLLDELVESYGHLKMAAGHAAGGAAEKVTPPYDRARGVAVRGWHTTKDAFTPLYDQMREGAANARKEYEVSKKKRWPALVGLLAAGAAVGAAGAMVARRRRAASQWDTYEPLPAADDLGYGSDESAKMTAAKKVTAGAASVADSVSSGAGKIADSLHEKSGSLHEKSGRAENKGSFAPFAEEDSESAAKSNTKNKP